jgi:hypothetical protein
MPILSELLTAVLDYLRAEAQVQAQSVGRKVCHTLAAVILAWMGCVLAMVGIGLLLTAVFIALKSALGAAIAALLTGGIALFLSLIVLTVARCVRR